MTSTLAAAGQPVVPTRVQNVVETLHGVKVSDPYRWLESAEDPEVVRWTAAQTAYMRKRLDAVKGRAGIEKRLWQLHEIGSLGTPVPTGSKAGGKPQLFYTRRGGKQNQPVLYVRDGGRARAGERVLLDVNQLAADGTLALDFWDASDDGTLIAYGTSRDGSEESTLQIREVATGRDRPDKIPRTRAASVAWLPDASGLYYTRYPEPGSVPPAEEKYHRAVFFHPLGGDPKNDARIFPAAGETRDMSDWPGVKLSPDGRWLCIEVSQGWTRSEIFLLDRKQPDGKPRPVVTGRDAIFSVVEAANDRLYVLTNDRAPRYRVFTIDPGKPEPEHWRDLIAESPETLESVRVAHDHIVATYLKDASSRVRVFSRQGKPEREIVLPGLGTVSGVSGRARDRDVYYQYSSFLAPGTVFRLDAKNGRTEIWDRLDVPWSEEDFAVEQVRYRSKDGTSIPMFLVHKRNLARGGANPTLLYGYGGFNISVTPKFAAAIAPFLDAGGVYAVANLRGGAEYGEDWHRAGMLGKKQNVFDDFIAAAEYLVAEKITSREHLAIEGRSNGGLLIGAAITQRPDLFRAAICGVPLLDMVRYHKFRIARLWIPEYGDPENPADFAWLYAYSPYHRVRPGTGYPATLIFTALSDTRVDAMHARKMTAALQAANAGAHPILLRLETQAGHGAGKPLHKQIAQFTDELAFLFSELGMTVPEPAAKAAP